MLYFFLNQQSDLRFGFEFLPTWLSSHLFLFQENKLVKHRTFKVIKITKNNDEFYHISSVPQFNQYDPDFSEIATDVKIQNQALYKAIDRFLNSSK